MKRSKKKTATKKNKVSISLVTCSGCGSNIPKTRVEAVYKDGNGNVVPGPKFCIECKMSNERGVSYKYEPRVESNLQNGIAVHSSTDGNG